MLKRPMCILAVSWLAGMVLAGRGPEVRTNGVLFLYLFLVILGLLVLKKHPQLLNSQVQTEWYPQLTLLLICIPCLFLAGYWRAEMFSEKQAEQELFWQRLSEEGETYVTVEGTVKGKSVEERVTLELTDCVIVGYFGEENQSVGDCRVLVDGEGKEWLPESFLGNKIRVFGKFSVFQPASNPGQFDAYGYYKGQGLFADVSALRITVLDAETDRLGQSMSLLKQRLRECMVALYPEDKAGVLTAMILGDKELLSEEVELLYRQAGISHILAISGLHISLLAMGLFQLLRKLTVWPKAATVATIVFLVFYVLLTGAGTSSLRAGIMCVILLGAGWFRRSYDMLSSLALAAVFVTAFRPSELTSVGFLLSFGAVLGVALAQEAEYVIVQSHEGKRPWWCIFLFGGMIQCITIPISLWFFYELSPYSILLNLVVIPMVSLILGGGIVSAVFGSFFPVLAKLPVGGTCLLLEFYEWICEWSRSLPFSFVLLGRPAVWQMVLYYGGITVTLFLFFRKSHIWQKELQRKQTRQKKSIAGSPVCCLVFGILCVAAVLIFPKKIAPNLLFLDVSQGDGALITTAEGTVILSDCGSSDVSKVGEYRLSPVLKQKGISLVDMAVISHLDSDHTSGIKEILESMPEFTDELLFYADYNGIVGIKELVLPKVTEKSEAYTELEKLAMSKQVQIRYIRAGEMLYQEDELLMECIYPQNAKESENDTSLVFLLQTPKLLAWLMGDAGTAPEAELVGRLATVNMDALREGKMVLLKVGHHGSKTSSGEAFVDFVQPDFSVISCGYRNTYGHPHAEVVERLVQAESRVFRTDLQGAIVVEFGRFGKPKVYGWKERAGALDGILKKLFCEE